MSYLLKNNAYSTLASALASGGTSLAVGIGHGDRFPVVVAPDYTVVTLEDAVGRREIVKITARAAASDVLTIVRAQESTIALNWAAGDIVELRFTAGTLQDAINATDAHIVDVIGAHAASAIANTPSGNLAATDVQTALNELDAEKVAIATKDATGGYAGLTLFAINFKNALNTFTSFFTNANTAARTYTFKDANGTIAFTSDITGTNSGTNTGDQTNISGTASNVTGIVAVSNGGTGTATPAIVAGTNITVSGTFPNQTINASGGTGLLNNIQYFTATGTYTPTPGTSFVIVEVLGGGGGAAGTGSNAGSIQAGGGGGGYSRKKITSAFSGVTVTIGAGGGGGVPNAANITGSGGGTSSFGSLVSASGGSSGANITQITGGSGSLGDINISGGISYALPTVTESSSGGSSFYSPPAKSNVIGVFGGGGGGASALGGTGRAGGSGLVIVWEYK